MLDGKSEVEACELVETEEDAKFSTSVSEGRVTHVLDSSWAR
jgi:hypothetical protein